MIVFDISRYSNSYFSITFGLNCSFNVLVQICIRMRVLKFYHFCKSNNFFMMGWKCRKEKLLYLFCRNINSPFSGALGLNSFYKVLIDHCLFSEKLLENHWFYVWSIISPLWLKLLQCVCPFCLLAAYITLVFTLFSILH